MSAEEIAERIETILKSRNDSRANMCKQLGFNYDKIAQWKTKDANPYAIDLYLMANYLQVPMEYLITGHYGKIKDIDKTISDTVNKAFDETKEEVCEMMKQAILKRLPCNDNPDLFIENK